MQSFKDISLRNTDTMSMSDSEKSNFNIIVTISRTLEHTIYFPYTKYNFS